MGADLGELGRATHAQTFEIHNIFTNTREARARGAHQSTRRPSESESPTPSAPPAPE